MNQQYSLCQKAVWTILAFVALWSAIQPAAEAHRHHRYHDRSYRHERVLPSRGFFVRGDMAEQRIFVPSPAREIRAMWVVRESITSPAQVQNVVNTAAEYGFNTLFVQVCGRGDSFYTSSILPRSEELANQPAAFDPLATVIQEAHARGIQVHAWINTFYVWGANQRPLSPDHVVNAHPEWLVQDRSGNTPTSAQPDTEGAFLSPANPDARQHIHDVFLEIAKNYDVDGIHFDYVRYPSQNYDYSPATIQEFTNYVNQTVPPADQLTVPVGDPLGYVHTYPDLWADWRRDQVTQLVAGISHDVKAIKPWVVISAAVFADAHDAYVSRGQDWKSWLQQGLIDVVIPMAYNNSTALVGKQLRDAEETAHQYGRYCYAGIGSYHISPESTAEKIAVARELGVQGIVLFSYGGVTQYGNSTAYLDKLRTMAFQKDAQLPSLSWVPERPQGESANPQVQP